MLEKAIIRTVYNVSCVIRWIGILAIIFPLLILISKCSYNFKIYDTFLFNFTQISTFINKQY